MIHTADAPCWRIVINGEDHDSGDGVQHFSDEASARATIDTDNPDVTAEAFAEPCEMVRCDGCEEELENDVFTLHFENGTAEAHDFAVKSDWTVTDDGRMYCWGCSAPDEDEAHTAEAAR